MEKRPDSFCDLLDSLALGLTLARTTTTWTMDIRNSGPGIVNSGEGETSLRRSNRASTGNVCVVLQ